MDWERHINIGCINAKFTGIKKPKKKKKCNEERFQEAIAVNFMDILFIAIF